MLGKFYKESRSLTDFFRSIHNHKTLDPELEGMIKAYLVKKLQQRLRISS